MSHFKNPKLLSNMDGNQLTVALTVSVSDEVKHAYTDAMTIAGALGRMKGLRSLQRKQSKHGTKHAKQKA